MNHNSLLLSSSSSRSNDMDNLHILCEGPCNAVDSTQFPNSHGRQNYFQSTSPRLTWRRKGLTDARTPFDPRVSIGSVSSVKLVWISDFKSCLAIPHPSQRSSKSHPNAYQCSQYNSATPNLYLQVTPSRFQLPVVVFYHQTRCQHPTLSCRVRGLSISHLFHRNNPRGITSFAGVASDRFWKHLEFENALHWKANAGNEIGLNL